MILSDNTMTLSQHKDDLMGTFKMKDLGPIDWFLGLEIMWDRVQCLISVSQTQYITDIVSHFGFTSSCQNSTPIHINFKLPLLDSPEIDAHDYQSRIGSIMCAMLRTHPDIAYAVGALSQFSANPGTDHLSAVNQLFQYLNSTKDLKLLYDGNSSEHDLNAYSDSDWAGDPCDHCSLSGYVFKIAGGAVTWSSKKQPSTALSSTEGEYMALTHTAQEAIWIQQFLGDILFPPTVPTTILGDNHGALALTFNPAFHACMKHIHVHHHFIRDCITNQDIKLKYILMADQVADVLTKGLPVAKHSKFMLCMGLIGVHAC